MRHGGAMIEWAVVVCVFTIVLWVYCVIRSGDVD
jgi:hypothetical protein